MSDNLIQCGLRALKSKHLNKKEKTLLSKTLKQIVNEFNLVEFKNLIKQMEI